MELNLNKKLEEEKQNQNLWRSDLEVKRRMKKSVVKSKNIEYDINKKKVWVTDN